MFRTTHVTSETVADDPVTTSPAPRPRGPRPVVGLSRIIVLAIVALLAGGVAYLRFAPQAAGPSVPAGVFAVITALTAAAIGANLCLLSLDIASERAATQRQKATTLPAVGKPISPIR